MTTFCALLVGASLTNDGLTTDQRRTVSLRLSRAQRRLHRRRIVTVYRWYDMPAVGFKSTRCIVRKPTLHLAINRDAIVIVDRDQFAQTQRAGQRAGFVGYPLHQTAVSQKHPGVVVYNRMSLAIELCCQSSLSDGHPDCVCQPLPERPGSRFHTRRITIFGMSGCFAV